MANRKYLDDTIGYTQFEYFWIIKFLDINYRVCAPSKEIIQQFEKYFLIDKT